ncbi:MAG: putative Ig domain-containing protein [Bacteroidota bacterium]
MKKITLFLAPIVCLLFCATTLAAEKFTDCVPADQPVVSTSSLTNCSIQTSTLSITSGNLNDSANWVWYAGSCEGPTIGTGTSIQVVPFVTTTYYVRGEGGCATLGSCVSITITVMSLYSSAQPFALNGSAAANGDNCYLLTSDVDGYQKASAWYPSQIDLSNDFDLRFTINQCGSADGMMFVMQNSGTNGLGEAGSDLGYYTIGYSTSFPHSLGVEFDIYSSGMETYYDSNNTHISVVKDGNPQPVAPIYDVELIRCENVPVRFTWNHITHLFSIYYDSTLVTSYTADLVNTIFNGNSKVYMGFTGGTGGLNANQSFCVDSLIYNQNLNLITDITTPPCGSAIIGSNASATANYFWSTGATTPTITVTEPGTYSLTVSNNNGCSDTAFITVTALRSAPSISYSGVASVYTVEDNITLSPSTVGNQSTSYSINPALPSGLNFDTTSGVISGQPYKASLTEYTITASNGCGSVTTTISFAVECTPGTTPSVSISVGGANNALCQGNSVILTATTGNSFLWSTGQTTSNITVTTSGIYTLERTNTLNGCKGVAVPRTIVFNTPPNITYPNFNSVYPIDLLITATPQNAGGYPSKTVLSTTVPDSSSYVYSMVADSSGNIYYGDVINGNIKKLAPDGVITAYGGEGDFITPNALTIDAAGNVYVIDNELGTIKKITPDGTVTTLYSDLGNCVGIARDVEGNLYYSTAGPNAIRKIAVDGTNTLLLSATISYSMYIDSSGNLIYMDLQDRSLRKLTPNGVLTVLASGFKSSTIGIAPDSHGNIYVATGIGSPYFIKKVSPDGAVSTVCPVTSIHRGIVLDASNNLYTCRTSDSTILKMALSPNYSITPALPAGMVFDGETGAISGAATVETPLTTYTIAAQNSCGSNNATVSFATKACPIIDSIQAKVFICGVAGSTSSVSVGTSGASGTYTWQYRVPTKTNPNPTWITITSAHSAVYSNYNTGTLGITRTTSLPAVGTQYRVLVNGAADCPQSTSDIASLTVITATKAGTISVPSTTVCLGGDLTFTVTNPVGTSLQWQSSPFSSSTAPGTFTDIPGAIDFTYTLTNAQLNSDRSYRVVVTNACNGTTATSSTKTITVNPPSVAGTVTGGGVVCTGGSGTLKVAGYRGKIQWEYSADGVSYANAPKTLDGQTIPFGTTSTNSTAVTYLVTTITSDLYFRAKVTNGACSSVYTTPVQFIIKAQAEVGTIAAAETTVCSGTGTTLTLSEATGYITWQKSVNYTLATPTWTNTTNHSLSYPTGNLSYNTAFRAMVTIGSCSTVYSNVAYVYLVPKPLAKTITANITIPSGKTVLNAMCTDDVPKILTIGGGYVGNIQWERSAISTTTGFSVIEGATSSSYTITNPFVGANYYRARFTNSCGVAVVGAAVTVYYKDCGNTEGGEIVKAARPAFHVTAYPNPYSENFNLELSTSSVDEVGIRVYDMAGKMIYKYEVRPRDMADIQIGEGYPSGIYNVVITQGDEIKTLRLIKR